MQSPECFTGRHGEVAFYRRCAVFACLCADAERSATRETSHRSPSSSSLSTRLCLWSCARSTQLSITLLLTCLKKSSWWMTTAMTVSANGKCSFPISKWGKRPSTLIFLKTKTCAARIMWELWWSHTKIYIVAPYTSLFKGREFDIIIKASNS